MATSDPALTINVFELDDGRFGIRLSDTREVFRLPAITSLPNAPTVVEGIVNIRGRVVPVFNLRRRFGLPDRAPHPAQHLLYASAGSRLVGLRVDQVKGAVQIAAKDIEISKAITTGTCPFTGVAKLDDGLILIHDLGTFLQDAEAADLDKAMAAARS